MAELNLLQRALVRLEVLEHLGMGLCVVGPDLLVREWNAVLSSRCTPTEHALGRSVLALMEPNLHRDGTLDRVRVLLHRVLREGGPPIPLETTVTFADPTHQSCRLVAMPVETDDGERLAALMFFEACEATRIREEFLRILDSAPDGIMIIDPDRRIRVFNRACGELLGRDPVEVIESNCFCGDVVHCHAEDGTSFAEAMCPAKDLFSGRETHQTEQMLATNSKGEERWIETTYSAIRGPRGDVEFIVGIMRDIDERKRLEEKLRQTEKLASLGALTAGIAHEIKNPLGIILSSVELILDDHRPREMQREAAQYIRDEVRRLDDRIRSFLSFARPRPIQREPVVLNGLIRRTVKGFALASDRVPIALELESPELIIGADPDQLQQVLVNLLLNAQDAINGSGRILVRTRSEAGRAFMEVHDSGPGISPDVVQKAFDPFFTTKAHGTGLGLSVVYQIITAHGGTVHACKSCPLGGAKFAVVLPTGY